MKPVSLHDTDLLARLPVGQWFRAGDYPVHGSKLNRLVRLGLLKRRARGFRAWTYLRVR